ncbi:MAG: cohesin domain-containing protein, partial [Patescibacteria group bacterium]
MMRPEIKSNLFRVCFAFLFSANFALLPLVARAASTSFYLQAPSVAVPPGSEIAVKILVDSSVPLNAYRAVVSFPPALLSFMRADNSRSLIDVWQSEPRAAGEGLIEFAGGSVKSFLGERGELVTLRFIVNAEGNASLAFREAEGYIADGKGTRSEAETRGAQIFTRVGAIAPSEPGTTDRTPPRLENIALIEDPLNKNLNLLNLSVKDEGTGVGETFVRAKTWIFWSDWERLNTPIAVKKNVWAIDIRTTDNAGNLTAQIVYNWRAFFGNAAPLLL